LIDSRDPDNFVLCFASAASIRSNFGLVFSRLVEKAHMANPKRGSRPGNSKVEGVPKTKPNKTLAIVGSSVSLPQAINSRERLFGVLR
jgi:hypothetical protein